MNVMALYRGYSEQKKQWVCGYYVPYTDKKNVIHHFIVIPTLDKPPFPYVEVVEQSLGQYIGQQDQLGRMVYTGDIIRVHDPVTNTHKNEPVVYCSGDTTFECEVGRNCFFDFWEWGCKHALIIGKTYPHDEAPRLDRD